MNLPQSNIKSGRVAEDIPGLRVQIPDAEELLRLEDIFRARFETYAVLRDSLIEAVQRTKIEDIHGLGTEEVSTGIPLPVPIVAGSPANLAILHNLGSAVEMLKVAARTYTVLRVVGRD
jgi:hypothetical protein